LLTALIAALSAPAYGREGTIGIVRGAEALYVREGPGTEYTAFETLLKGAEVQVERVEGSWAAIHTPSGRTGWVHATFLELQGTPTAGEATASQAGQDTTRGAVAPTPAAAEPPADENAVVAQAPPSSDPAARVDAPPAAAPIAGGGGDAKDELLWDVKRILRLTEELHGRFAKRTDIDEGSRAMEDSRAPGVASTLALSGIGMLFGFILGSLYGRRLERNRRTRVRF
jgi:uncharacterized protein YraI